jgi:N-acetylmuramoyl-L-alanine amidase
MTAGDVIRCVAAVLATAILLPATAQAQSAAVRYERALAREKQVRASEPTAAALRAAAKAFEAIVHRYPVSGYADNALWQAAGLLKFSFDRSGDAADLANAARLLTWLRREYPSSSLAKEAAALLSTMPAAEPAANVAAADVQAESRSSAAAPAAPDATTVRRITHTPLPRGDRIIVELTQEAAYSGERVDGPDRVFFDFANAVPATDVVQHVGRLAGAFVKNVRVGQQGNGVTRVVLELGGANRPRYSAFPLYAPFRLVIDIESTDPAPAPPVPMPMPLPTKPPESRPPSAPPAVVAVTPPPAIAPPATAPGPASATSAGDYSLSRQLGLSVARVVIDPGHGGHDPGAQANGVKEAELVLDIAQRVARLLALKPGIEVVLTRQTDEFIPLEERTAIANRHPADLFLSIHANASRNPAARGVETYYLNFATNADAEAVAARENATSAQTMGALPSIIKTIALNDKRDESRELATILQTGLVRRLRSSDAGVRDLGVKQAPFVVLVGAQMPSVLAEISFLTNKTEAAQLKKESYRQQIAQAIADSVVKYQASLKKITTDASAGR